MEVFLSGAWGTIGYSSFSMHEAQVICNQLGLPAESELEKIYKGISEISSLFTQM